MMLKTDDYCISKENIAAHELIGLGVNIKESTDNSRIGIHGKVIDETKNLLLIETRRGLKKIPKKECVFEFELGKEKTPVDGKKIVEKPENRIKNFWRKRNAM
ncbi:MAG: ribonuclease P protein component 1 [Candidatus Diapherotrites archaeon]|nr:ribonuclease P protein component 1 [Candidatus Diapherotrites archaeon]